VEDFPHCSFVTGCNTTDGTDNACIDCAEGMFLERGACVASVMQEYMREFELAFSHESDRAPSLMKLDLRTSVALYLSTNGVVGVTPDDVVVLSYTQKASDKESGMLSIVAIMVLDVDLATHKLVDDQGLLDSGRSIPLQIGNSTVGNKAGSAKVGDKGEFSESGSSGLAGWEVALIVIAVAVVIIVIAVVIAKRKGASSYSPSSMEAKESSANTNPIFEDGGAEDDGEF